MFLCFFFQIYDDMLDDDIIIEVKDRQFNLILMYEIVDNGNIVNFLQDLFF